MTEHTHIQTPFPNNLHPQLEATCRELNERIARLALVLNLSLDQPADMQRLMAHRPTAPTAPGGTVLGLLDFGQETSRREEQLWIELRGLVVLRDELEKLCVEAVGYVATSDIMVDVAQRMRQLGFPPGVDGLDLERLQVPTSNSGAPPSAT